MGRRPLGLPTDLRSCQLRGDMAISLNNHYSGTGLHGYVWGGSTRIPGHDVWNHETDCGLNYNRKIPFLKWRKRLYLDSNPWPQACNADALTTTLLSQLLCTASITVIIIVPAQTTVLHVLMIHSRMLLLSQGACDVVSERWRRHQPYPPLSTSPARYWWHRSCQHDPHWNWRRTTSRKAMQLGSCWVY